MTITATTPPDQLNDSGLNDGGCAETHLPTA